jgi:hypothetical protein
MSSRDDKLAILGLAAYNAIWEEPGTRLSLFNTSVVIESLVRGDVHRIVYKNVTFLTQNPNKGSRYAKMARDGSKIMWGIIRREGREWWKVRVIDGEVAVRLHSSGEWVPTQVKSSQHQVSDSH